ncbi:hypothetical protein E2C01_002118 [Portunus trituberculatus]|uniref:Uncharacterized protein n=1 Tax=Portunus trituberculatus TaxID=210409 RepID=A0A5B7CJQ4_PORTR|nr:hypothetical protein [Portunus trituberculatus]
MATVNYTTPSPFTEKQSAHVTDYRHQGYLIGAGLATANKKYNKPVPEDLKVVNVALFALGRAAGVTAFSISNQSSGVSHHVSIKHFAAAAGLVMTGIGMEIEARHRARVTVEVCRCLDDLSVTAEDTLRVTTIASTLEKSVISGKMEQVVY